MELEVLLSVVDGKDKAFYAAAQRDDRGCKGRFITARAVAEHNSGILCVNSIIDAPPFKLLS